MRRSFVALVLSCLILACRPAQAFWLLGFSPAPTMPDGSFGFISGTGTQFTQVGDPSRSSFTPALAHAGFRLGLGERLDAGYRLCTVSLPFSSVGPNLGSALDVKLRLSDPQSRWQTAIVAGGAYAYVGVSGQSKDAWSPGADLIVSRAWSEKSTVFAELRWVYTAIPTAPGGSDDNHLTAIGTAAGAKIAWTPQVSVVPELGIFDFSGRLAGRDTDGIGLQLGVVFAVGGLPRLW